MCVEGFSKAGDYNNTNDSEIEINASAKLSDGQNLEWSMSAYTTNSKLRPSGYIQAFRQFYEWHLATDCLPVLAYYSDSFPHKEDNKRLVNNAKIDDLRNFGYFDWNEEEGCSKVWIERLERDLINIRQNKDKISKLSSSNKDSLDKNSKIIEIAQTNIEIWQHEVNAIESCLVNFSKSIAFSEEDGMAIAVLDLHSDSLKLCLNTCDGNEIPFTNLPSGYKRLFNIVLDLAFRSYLLSGKKSTDIPGIAIIDEIDLHLHPELENIALSKLLQIFPKIQFIVSTHSVNVLTSISTTDGKSCILQMIKGSKDPIIYNDIFGLDPNSAQQEIMGVRLNGEELECLLDQCAYMISIGLKEESHNLELYIVEKSQISEEETSRRIGQKLKLLEDAIHR